MYGERTEVIREGGEVNTACIEANTNKPSRVQCRMYGGYRGNTEGREEDTACTVFNRVEVRK